MDVKESCYEGMNKKGKIREIQRGRVYLQHISRKYAVKDSIVPDIQVDITLA